MHREFAFRQPEKGRAINRLAFLLLFLVAGGVSLTFHSNDSVSSDISDYVLFCKMNEAGPESEERNFVDKVCHRLQELLVAQSGKNVRRLDQDPLKLSNKTGLRDGLWVKVEIRLKSQVVGHARLSWGHPDDWVGGHAAQGDQIEFGVSDRKFGSNTAHLLAMTLMRQLPL